MAAEMAAEGRLDCFVHFETFRNIALRRQGIYCIRACMGETREVVDAAEEGDQQRAPVKRFYSRPAHLTSMARGVEVEGSNIGSTGSTIVGDGRMFRSRSFLIRYVEEQVQLNDGVVFQFHMTPQLLMDGIAPVLKVELVFLGELQGKDAVAGSEKAVCVAEMHLALQGASKGVHVYSPVVFSQRNFCQLSTTIHTALHSIQWSPSLEVSSATNDTDYRNSGRAAATLKPSHGRKDAARGNIRIDTIDFPKLAVEMMDSYDKIRQLYANVFKDLGFKRREVVAQLHIGPLSVSSSCTADVEVDIFERLRLICNETLRSWHQFIEFASICHTELTTLMHAKWQRDIETICDLHVIRDSF